MDSLTKKKIGAYFIVGMFVISTFGYFAFYSVGHTNTQNLNIGDYFIVEGALDRNTEISLLNNGITLVKLYYKDESYKSITDDLQEETSTYTGSRQLSIQKINSDDDYVIIENYQNSSRFNSTVDTIVSDTCGFLIFETPGCLISEN